MAIRLLEPAIASGVQSIDLIRTPPSDQRIAAARRNKTCLFKRCPNRENHRALQLAEGKSCVVTAKSEGIIEGQAHLPLARYLWDVVKITFRIGVIQIDC